MVLEEGPTPQNTQSNVRAHWEREASLIDYEGTHSRVPVPEMPLLVFQLESSAAPMQHQFDLLL